MSDLAHGLCLQQQKFVCSSMRQDPTPTNDTSVKGGCHGFEERAEALQLICRSFLEYLGHGDHLTNIVAEDEPYEIPRDGSELLVIHHLSQPALVKSYMVYSEPGMPLVRGEYHSLEHFIRTFYRDDNQRSAFYA
jgi:hypothetical protein